MSPSTLSLVKAAKASEIARHCDLICGAEELLNDTCTPAEFLDLLIEREFYTNAIRFLAHALPRREAVWWGCVCLRMAVERLPAVEEAALKSAVKWVIDPKEENRWETEKASEKATLDTAAGRIAFGAFSSGNTMVQGASVPPEPSFAPEAIGGAIFQAAQREGGKRLPHHARKFLTLGVEIANGKHRWLPRKT